MRYDEYATQFDTTVEQQITVVKVLEDAEEAESEADRLNHLNGAKGVRYWAQVTRMLEAGSVSDDASVGEE